MSISVRQALLHFNNVSDYWIKYSYGFTRLLYIEIELQPTTYLIVSTNYSQLNTVEIIIL